MIILIKINTTLGVLDAVGVRTPAAIEGNLYAFWSEACSLNKSYTYLAIGRSVTVLTYSYYINTTRTNTGSISQELDGVIRSVHNVTKDTLLPRFTQSIWTKLCDYNDRLWTVITMHYYDNGMYPEAYARISGVNKVRASYEGQFKYDGTDYINEIVYYYD